MSGGDGENTIVTKAGSSITGTATSTAQMGSVSINIVGGVVANAGSTAASLATGLAGGKDADTIRNEGAMTLTATATSNASGKAIQLIGGGTSNAKAVATATATGIVGGDGENTLVNLSAGTINAQATATGNASSYKIDLVGAGVATAGIDANATALGIAGGKDADTIRNDGAITAGATSTLTSISKTYEMTGAGIADARSNAVSTAVGIDGARRGEPDREPLHGSRDRHLERDGGVRRPLGHDWHHGRPCGQHGAGPFRRHRSRLG